MNDLISRQAAIEVIEKMMEVYWDRKVILARVWEQIKDLPSAQPLVRCKDCKWYVIEQLKKDGTDDRRYKPSYCTLLRHNFKPDWFCADGERKEDERT